MKKTAILLFFAVIIASSEVFSKEEHPWTKGHPYGINAWNWPLSTCELYKKANFMSYRVMVSWGEYEVRKGSYDWNTQSALNEALDSAEKLGAKLSLCIYDSPGWARAATDRLLSYSPEDYAEFAVKCVEYCEGRHKGIVESVEMENENPTGVWIDSLPISHGTWYRDASWNYANILKQSSRLIRAYNRKNNRNILVIMDAVWSSAYHHIDDLYQLGCRDYFDRLNFHYYLGSMPEDPADKNTVGHFDTTLRYVKYLAEQNGDRDKPVWITEFGWRYDLAKHPEFEEKRVRYNGYLTDTARKSGFVERLVPYVGTAHWGTPPNDFNDGMDIIYVDNHKTPSWHRETPLYKMFAEFNNKHAAWPGKSSGPMDVLPAASKDIVIENEGFEKGTADNWNNLEIDSVIFHSGRYSGRQAAPAEIRTAYHPVDKRALYEVVFYVKVETDNPDNFIMYPSIMQQVDDMKTTAWAPSNYYGISDTRHYPGGWRRLRFMYFAAGENQIALKLEAKGRGTFWVDDLRIKSLNLAD